MSEVAKLLRRGNGAMKKVWAVANQKGGVGKTTTTVTLAGHFAREGHRTLMIDLDPHGSLTTYFRLDPDTIDPSAYTLFKNKADKQSPKYYQIIQKTQFQNLWILPASTALATLDRQLGAKEGMGLVIAQAVKDLEQQYDYVFIDCPPMLGVLMVNALAACQQLIIPVQTEFLAIKGLERMLHTLNMITRSRGETLEHLIVPTMFDRRTRASSEGLEVLQQRFADHMWSSVIPIDTQFREASKMAKPLSIWQPRSRGARAYGALVDDLLERPRTEPFANIISGSATA